MREAEIEAIFVSRVKRAGGLAFKFVSPGNTGVPDRIVIFPGGKIWFVELKADAGQLRPTQKRQIAKLKSQGANVFVLKGMDGLQEFMKDVMLDG